MQERLEQLQNSSSQLESSADQRRDWERAVLDYAHQFLGDLPNLKAYDAHPDNGKAITELDIPQHGRSMQELLPAIRDNVDRNGINPASGRHFGYIPGGGVYTSALGDYLAAVTNRYAGMFFANPGAVRIEYEVIRWMCRMVGYPGTALGNLTSGGSIANLIAVTTAREHYQVKARDIEQLTVYLTGQVHHCVQKAFRIAGMGEVCFRQIPMDNRFRMDPDALALQLKKDKASGLQPFMIIGSAGTTDTGAVDPLRRLADLAEVFDCWFHVDAAYGGFFALVDSLREKFEGIERADSIVIDPHKGLFLSYGVGAVLVKNLDALFRANHYTASYLQDAEAATEELNPSDLSPELTKHFRGMRIWLTLQLLGVEPFRASLEEKALLCQYFYEQVQQLGFEVGPEPELSVMIYRYVPEDGDGNAYNEALVHHIQQQGRIFLSSTTIDGVYWIRLAVLSFRTHRAEIDECLRVLRDAVRDLSRQWASIGSRVGD